MTGAERALHSRRQQVRERDRYLHLLLRLRVLNPGNRRMGGCSLRGKIGMLQKGHATEP
jgi:hypothetical protein